VTDDRIVRFPRAGGGGGSHNAPVEDRGLAPEIDPHGRVTMGVEVSADRRLVLMVQTIAQLATLAKEADVPLDDGLLQGADRLARSLRGAGLALPVHLEDALDEIAASLSPGDAGEEPGAEIVPFQPGSSARPASE
jgi:hypothetical protein